MHVVKCSTCWNNSEALSLTNSIVFSNILHDKLLVAVEYGCKISIIDIIYKSILKNVNIANLQANACIFSKSLNYFMGTTFSLCIYVITLKRI